MKSYKLKCEEMKKFKGLRCYPLYIKKLTWLCVQKTDWFYFSIFFFQTESFDILVISVIF